MDIHIDRKIATTVIIALIAGGIGGAVVSAAISHEGRFGRGMERGYGRQMPAGEYQYQYAPDTVEVSGTSASSTATQ